MINVKNFPLTTVAMSNNCAPFLTMIIACVILPSDKPASLLEFLATVVAVIGATLVVQGGVIDTDDDANMKSATAIMYFFLILYPIAKASGTVLFRLLKKIDSMTILSW